MSASIRAGITNGGELSVAVQRGPLADADPDRLQNVFDAFAAKGRWLVDYQVDMTYATQPEQYLGYFLVAAGPNRGAIVTGSYWDQSANPGFTIVDPLTGQLKEGDQNRPYLYLVDLAYLGQTYDPSWTTRFSALSPVPNSPADLLARQFDWDGVDTRGYFICMSSDCYGSIGRVLETDEVKEFVTAYGWLPERILYVEDMSIFVPLVGSEDYDQAWEESAITLRTQYLSALPRTLDFDPSEPKAVMYDLGAGV